MKGLPFVLIFTALTFVSWGAYGPVLHHGALALDHDSMRAFVGVGLAYFLIAVIFPFFVLKKYGEAGKWTMVGTLYSLFAGVVGALGALGIIFALGNGGKTVYVMPLVFGFAPVVNTLVTAFLSRTFNQISPVFIGGIIAAALGAGGVLFFKPAPAPSPAATEPAAESAADSEPGAEDQSDSSEAADESETKEDQGDGAESSESEENPEGDAAQDSAPSDDLGDVPTRPEVVTSEASAPGEETAAEVSEEPKESGGASTNELPPDGEEEPEGDTAEEASASSSTEGNTTNWLNVVLSIVMAALCWGAYGPVLHIGQAKMAGSRLRPFACVGIAYFLIAVAAPLVLIYSRAEDLGSWTANGMLWSFAAGIAGAIGALGVILAFNAGGKPYYVMPLIFGFAPVINTFISLTESGTWSQVSFAFYVSLAVVIAGAVTVLTNSPKPKPKPAAEAS